MSSISSAEVDSSIARITNFDVEPPKALLIKSLIKDDWVLT